MDLGPIPGLKQGSYHVHHGRTLCNEILQGLYGILIKGLLAATGRFDHGSCGAALEAFGDQNMEAAGVLLGQNLQVCLEDLQKRIDALSHSTSAGDPSQGFDFVICGWRRSRSSSTLLGVSSYRAVGGHKPGETA